VDALTAAGIKFVAIKAPGSGSQMDDMASATGGAVTTTDASSTEIVEAILSGLEELTFTVTGAAQGCDPIVVSFAPDAHQNVAGTETVVFQETIAVPAGTMPGDYACSVDFFADDVRVATQRIQVRVNGAPEAACVETTNPDGNAIPKAGQGLTGPGSGQNEDGFYELQAEDEFTASEDLEVYVLDSGSGTVFGPFAPGTRIKYTQAQDAQPQQKPMGGGPANAVSWHITGNGDAFVFAVDSDDASSGRVACLVPAPDK
jgi:hypothetical protein